MPLTPLQEQLLASVEPTATSLAQATVIATGPLEVLDMELTADPTGTNPVMAVIAAPPELNDDFGIASRVQRLPIAYGFFTLLNTTNFTVAFPGDLTPPAMRPIGATNFVLITDDLRIARPHIYHPPLFITQVFGPGTSNYPLNTLSEVEDDESKNVDSRRLSNQERTRGLWRARTAASGAAGAVILGAAVFALKVGLFGLVAVLVLQNLARLVGQCGPDVTVISRTPLTCADGSMGERTVIRAPDCSVSQINTCTGEIDPIAGPGDATGAAIAVGLVIAGIAAVAIAAFALTRRRPPRPSPPPPAPQTVQQAPLQLRE